MSLLEARGNDARHALSALSQVRREIAVAGRNVWLAGLGAVAEVGEGSRGLFERLVEMGRPYEARRREAAGALLEKIEKSGMEMAREIGQLMQETAVYEGRKVLRRLPVLTRDDVSALGTRLDALASKLDDMAAAEGTIPARTIEITTKPIAGQGEAAPASRQRRTAKR